MRHVRLGLLLLFGLAAPAAGQDRLFVNGTEVGAVGHFFDHLGPAPVWIEAERFGGGRYVHASPNAVLDIATGRTYPLDEGWIVGYDRARPRVFAAREGGVWSVDVRTGWAVLVLPRLEGLSGCVHATSADVLLCAFARADGQHDLLRASLFGPIAVATVRFPFAFPRPNWVATPGGSAVYFDGCFRVSAQFPSFCDEPDVARLELTTGSVTRSHRPEGRNVSGQLLWDEAHDRLFTLRGDISVFRNDLAFIGSVSPGARCLSIAISPHTDTVYLAAFSYSYGLSWTTLSAYDASSYAVRRGPRERTFSGGGCGRMSLVTAPGKPRDLRAIVAGRTVALSWTNIGAASHFVLEAGTAPGRADLSFFVGPDPTVQFNGVPPGTYYVRVRGGNVVGGGRPSDELVVTVR